MLRTHSRSLITSNYTGKAVSNKKTGSGGAQHTHSSRFVTPDAIYRQSRNGTDYQVTQRNLRFSHGNSTIKSNLYEWVMGFGSVYALLWSATKNYAAASHRLCQSEMCAKILAVQFRLLNTLCVCSRWFFALKLVRFGGNGHWVESTRDLRPKQSKHAIPFSTSKHYT